MPASAEIASEEQQNENSTITDMPQRVADSRSEWTAERIHDAMPAYQEEDDSSEQARGLDLGKSAAAASTSVVRIAPQSTETVPFTQPKRSGLSLPVTIGKLTSKRPDGEDWSCTASVVTSEGRNLVYTAAHCVYNKNPETHIPHQCQMPTSASGDVVPNGIRMACAMTGGASGGPWTDAKYGKNRGDVIAVTSARKMKLVNGVKVPADSFVHGAPNTENTKTLYDHREAENAS